MQTITTISQQLPIILFIDSNEKHYIVIPSCLKRTLITADNLSRRYQNVENGYYASCVYQSWVK